jgi:hypothetical protein
VVDFFITVCEDCLLDEGQELNLRAVPACGDIDLDQWQFRREDGFDPGQSRILSAELN